MKIQHDQLSAHLARGLSPVYLITGEEILFSQEAEQLIHHAVLAAGCEECIRFTADSNFEWVTLQKAIQNGSLFSEMQYISLTLTTGKISAEAEKILLAFLAHRKTADTSKTMGIDKVLVIRMDKLTPAAQKTVWYKAIDKIGLVIPVWPLTPAQMPHWIKQRLQAVGLQTDATGLQLLAMRTEGNILATAQEIEKLSLLYPKGQLQLAEIEEATSNTARYSVFHLVDTILQGDPAAITKTLDGLKEEAVEPILVLWALARETRQWVQWLEAVEKGKILSQILSGNFFMEKRKPLIIRALQKQSLSYLYTCLQYASHIDKSIKGAAVGNVWDDLTRLALSLAGNRLC